MKIKSFQIRRYLPPIIAILLASTSLVTVGRGASLTGGNHGPISITSDTDFTTVDASTGCQCVSAGSGTPSDPYIIGPWTIMATSNSPGVLVQGVTKFFTLDHITVHGTGLSDGIDIFNVNAPLGPQGQPQDKILAVNLDGTANGIYIKNSSGILVKGDSINNSFLWGLRLEGSHDNTITFMTFAHNGLKNPASHPVTPEVMRIFLMQDFWGGVLFLNSDHNQLTVSVLSEDAFAGFVLVNSNNNVLQDLHSRYPDYFGGVLQSSSNNKINRISMQTADFVGLLIRGGNSNRVENSTFSANGPIGPETMGQIVPYIISGIYLGWGTHDNRITQDQSNSGNTGPGLLVDNGTIINPVQSPVQTQNPLNNPQGNDPGTVPILSAFQPGQSTVAVATSNIICGNSFANFAGVTNPNASC